jgi:hypothetical protein
MYAAAPLFVSALPRKAVHMLGASLTDICAPEANRALLYALRTHGFRMSMGCSAQNSMRARSPIRQMAASPSACHPRTGLADAAVSPAAADERYGGFHTRAMQHLACQCLPSTAQRSHAPCNISPANAFRPRHSASTRRATSRLPTPSVHGTAQPRAMQHLARCRFSAHPGAISLSHVCRAPAPA